MSITERNPLGLGLSPAPKGYIPHYEEQWCGYVYRETVSYYSPRYNRFRTIPIGYWSDGASGAFDIKSLSWGVHDTLCEYGVWDDGTPITNWQASCVLSDILHNEGRWFRARTWFLATYFFGCKKARKHGMFRRKA